MEDVMKTTPTIPTSVYETLPDLLKESCAVFEDAREKDVFLTSAISILSGCLPEVTGLYFNETIYTNLFMFIIAPPASGKGTMKFAKDLASVIHDEMLALSREKEKEYKIEARKFKKRHMGKNSQGDPDEEEPEKPPFKVLFIPANSSSSKVYEHIQDGGGKGIICETEADTLGDVFKNDWGSYSDLLRKAFHHERMSISRKTDNLFFEIENPQLSVVLTGTPNQIVNIIHSAEDGLFSRFLFYTFSAKPVWKSPAPKKDGFDLKEFFKDKAKVISEMYAMLSTSPTVVGLTKEQWEWFDDYFDSILKEVTAIVKGDATSVVKRLGTIMFRMCLIFTAIRKFEDGDTTKDLTCEDIDFDNAKKIVETLLEHSITLFTNLPGGENEFKISKATVKQSFFAALPNKFERKEAVKIGEDFNIPARTVDSLIGKTWLDSLIVRVDTGVYEKIE
jgi:hypothetical protein